VQHAARAGLVCTAEHGELRLCKNVDVSRDPRHMKVTAGPSS
jgi:hypothetical protein